jgi:hypothetical protein
VPVPAARCQQAPAIKRVGSPLGIAALGRRQARYEFHPRRLA